MVLYLYSNSGRVVAAKETIFFFLEFYILLTVHLDVILVNDQLDALCFLMYLFHASTCFEQQVLIIRRAKLY
jgi:hypothetical protein